MQEAICRRAASVGFWDGYAQWYKLWMEHTAYHDRTLDVLTTMAEPGWTVLDIGAGNGVLSMPLCAIGCNVTALEPSTAVRGLLYEKAFSRGIDWINVDDRKWEDVPLYSRFHNYDLVMACNSLHLTGIGFDSGLDRIFQSGPKRVFLVTELYEGFKINTSHEGYTLHFEEQYETESSFAYHDLNEAKAHWTFKKGTALTWQEELDLRSSLTYQDDHLWAKDTALVGMFWWEKNSMLG